MTDFISTRVELMTNKVFNKDGFAEIGHVFDHSFMMMGIEIGSNSARMQTLPLMVLIKPNARLLSAMLKGPNGNVVA